jgi:hypothetical protein
MLKEDSVQIPNQRSRILSFRPDNTVMRLDAHQCPEVSNNSRLHPSSVAATPPNAHQSSTRKSNFLLRHSYGKIDVSVRTIGQHRPDAILDKAKRGEELQLSGRQGNTVPDEVFIMVFTCSRSATARTLGQHCSDTTLIWYYVKRVMESRLHNCSSGWPQLASERPLEKSETNSI